MNKKVIIGSIIGVFLLIIIGFFGYQAFMQQLYKPGIKELEKKGIAVIYCTQNDEMPQVINTVTKKVKMDTYEVKPVVPYSTDKNAFDNRIKQENDDLSKVLYTAPDINVKKYGLITFATPLVDGKVCPVLEKYIYDNYKLFMGKPVAKIILRKSNEDPKDAIQYFYYRMADTYTKPGMILDNTSEQYINSMTDIWLGQMEFKRLELK